MLKRPVWLDKKINIRDCQQMKHLLKESNLHTVCEEAMCPNISECFAKQTATFMILGDTCTRGCRFCSVKKGTPSGIDPGEPARVAEAVKQLNLNHAVVTSVTRDDLEDGGSAVFADTVRAIRNAANGVTIEVLIPDFKCDKKALLNVVEAAPDIINHNLETVQRLYCEVRPQADYQRSLDVLAMVKELCAKKDIRTKSGIMVGMGEAQEEVIELFADLKNSYCDFLSIGQYLSPSFAHYPVKEYIRPEQFAYYGNVAEAMGFLYVASGPYVRSSYCAAEYLNSSGS